MGSAGYNCPDCGAAFLSRYAFGIHVKEAHPRLPQVLNRRDFPGALPPNARYVGRGSFAGNPYHIGRDGERDDVIEQYIAEKSQDESFMERVRRELRGFDLICHCAPKRCHADWLVQVANAPES